jgi:hypothetical protein
LGLELGRCRQLQPNLRLPRLAAPVRQHFRRKHARCRRSQRLAIASAQPVWPGEQPAVQRQRPPRAAVSRPEPQGLTRPWPLRPGRLQARSGAPVAVLACWLVPAKCLPLEPEQRVLPREQDWSCRQWPRPVPRPRDSLRGASARPATIRPLLTRPTRHTCVRAGDGVRPPAGNRDCASILPSPAKAAGQWALVEQHAAAWRGPRSLPLRPATPPRTFRRSGIVAGSRSRIRDSAGAYNSI